MPKTRKPVAQEVSPAAPEPRATLVFVYGSLRRSAPEPLPPGAGKARAALEAGGDWMGEASIQGRLFDVGDYPAAVSSRSPAEAVRGEVWRVRHPRRLFAELDAYEEARPAAAREAGDAEYRRDRRRVRLAGGARASAWVYLYAGEVDSLPRIDSGDYVGFRRAARAAAGGPT